MQIRVFSAVTLLSVFSLAGCEGTDAAQPLAPSQASLGMTTSERATPFAYTALNECNGDEVLLTGTLHTVIHYTSNRKGTTERVHSNLTGVKAVGVPSGAEYIGVVVSRTMTNHTAPAGDVYFSATDVVNLISKGSEPNFQAHMASTLRFNENGDALVEGGEPEIRCNG